MKRNRVNVLTVINSASNITNETIDGKDYIVVRDVVPIVDDIVMNGRFYPSAEIKKSFNTLELNPMPLDHPRVNGKHVSASDPRAVNEYHVGAWLQNVKHADGRVSGDMWVDRRYAENSEKGKKLVERLDAMRDGESVDPIHISTGLGFRSIAANGESKNKRYREIVTNMFFDHVAILLDKIGAGTPEEGVGIFVNSDGSESEIELANLADAADCTREGWLNKTRFFFTNASSFSFDQIQSAIGEKLREGRPDSAWLYPESVWPDTFIYQDESKHFRQKYLIDDDGKAVFVGTPVEVVRKPTEYVEVHTNEDITPMKNMILNALKTAGKSTDGLTDDQLFTAYNEHITASTKPQKSEQTLALNENEPPAWAKTLIDQVTGLEQKFAANSDKELGTKRAAVKAKYSLPDSAVNAMDGELLNEMYATCVTAAPLNPGFGFQTNNENDQWKDYDLNAFAEEKK